MMTYGDPAWRSWVLPEDQGRPIIRRAFERDQLLRSATCTRSRLGRNTGRAVRGSRARLRCGRDEVFNAMGPNPHDRGLSRNTTLRKIGASRAACDDYFDVSIHRWSRTPIDETLSSLNDIVRAGSALPSAPRHGLLPVFQALHPRFATAVPLLRVDADITTWISEEEREMLPLCRTKASASSPEPLARIFAGNRTATDNPEQAATGPRLSEDFANRLLRESGLRLVERVVALARPVGEPGRSRSPAVQLPVSSRDRGASNVHPRPTR